MALLEPFEVRIPNNKPRIDDAVRWSRHLVGGTTQL